MNSIAKIIFDTLASGRGINLPGTGSLYVERDAAKFISKSEIRPPYNRVLYSRNQNESFESIIDIIEAQGVAREDAEANYAAWLDESKRDNGILEITEVGVLKHDFFYPSVALHDTLNPEGQGNIKLNSGSNKGRVWGMIALGVVSLAVIIFFIIALNRYLQSRRTTERVRTEQVIPSQRQPQSTVAGDSDANAAEQEAFRQRLEEYPAQSGDKVATGKISGWQKFLNIFRSKDKKVVAPAATLTPAAPVTTTPPQTHTPVEVPMEDLDNMGQGGNVINTEQSEPVYYVVAGVFADERNADKLIRKDLFMIGQGAYKKLPYGGDKTMVVIYSSTDQRSAVRQRNHFSDFDRGVWVYKEEK